MWPNHTGFTSAARAVGRRRLPAARRCLSPGGSGLFLRADRRVRAAAGLRAGAGQARVAIMPAVRSCAPNRKAFRDSRDLRTYHQAFIDRSTGNVFDLILTIDGPVNPVSMSQAIVRASTETSPATTIPRRRGAARQSVSRDSRPLAVRSLPATESPSPDSGQFTIFPGSQPAAVPEQRRVHPHSGHAGGRCRCWQGRRPTMCPACDLARAVANRSGTARKTHPLQ